MAWTEIKNHGALPIPMVKIKLTFEWKKLIFSDENKRKKMKTHHFFSALLSRTNSSEMIYIFNGNVDSHAQTYRFKWKNQFQNEEKVQNWSDINDKD